MEFLPWGNMQKLGSIYFCLGIKLKTDLPPPICAYCHKVEVEFSKVYEFFNLTDNFYLKFH